METDDLTPIDILTYITDELQCQFQNENDFDRLTTIFNEFLHRWEFDNSLDKIKHTQMEFETDLDWFNVSEPLSFKHTLQGKIVILDFFTYCCINCMHVLPELQALEERFPTKSGLVIIGVHSPKFENEQNSDNILAAIQRYGINHPIVNDRNSVLWRKIGIRCWPSLLVISPDGLPLLLLMGEGHRIFLEQFLEVAFLYFERKRKLDYSSLPLPKSLSTTPASNIRFPSKIACSPNGRLAVADTGNNRILVINANGAVIIKIGTLTPGFVDGDFQLARFNSPQGITFFDEDTLIIADTNNHAIRQITLSKCLVETLAGTGNQGNDRTGGRVGPLQTLSSPWDVAVFRTRDMDMSFHLDEENVPEKIIILIAMAGTHQIWGYFPEGIIWWKFRKFEPQCCVALIGNGLEENRNNSYPQNAAFAQPSGLAMAREFLFIADSESSSIRKASMVDGKVLPVVGGDRNPLNLFAFGDVDGKQFTAKLQHPLGVAYNHVNEKVYVADTYNHKIKVIDPTTNLVSTLAITDEYGNLVFFNEPAGLCVCANGKALLVADTNNHKIFTVDLSSLVSQTFSLDFSQSIFEADSQIFNDSLNLIVQMTLFRYKNVSVNFSITLADGLKFTENAIQKWSSKSLKPKFQSQCTTGIIMGGRFSIQLKNLAKEELKSDDITIQVFLSLCDTKSCLIKRFTLALNDNSSNKDQEIIESGEEYVNLYVDQSKITLK